jgi:hypothetical protein
MRKLFLLSSILLLTAAFALAQYGSQSGSSPSSSNMNQTTIEGCLAGSDGNYNLTDMSGRTYQLTGDTAKLQHHVGHTIRVTGTAASAGDMSGEQSGSMSAPSDSRPMFKVASFKHVSATCSASN